MLLYYAVILCSIFVTFLCIVAEGGLAIDYVRRWLYYTVYGGIMKIPLDGGCPATAVSLDSMSYPFTLAIGVESE